MAISLGFRHGVHPPEEKELTNQLPIRRMPYPDELVLPLRQHAGKPARAVREGGRPRRARRHARRGRRLHVGAHSRVGRRHGGGRRLVAAPGRLDGQAVRIEGRPVRAAGPATAARPALGGASHSTRSCGPCSDAGCRRARRRGVPDARQARAAQGSRGAHADHQRRRVRAVPDVRPPNDGRVRAARAVRHPRDDALARRHEVRRRDRAQQARRDRGDARRRARRISPWRSSRSRSSIRRARRRC